MYALPAKDTVERARIQQDTTSLSFTLQWTIVGMSLKSTLNLHGFAGGERDPLWTIDVSPAELPFNALAVGLMNIPQIVLAANIVHLDPHLVGVQTAPGAPLENRGRLEPWRTFFSTFKNLSRLSIGDLGFVHTYLSVVIEDPQAVNWTSLRTLVICGHNDTMYSDNFAKALAQIYTRPSTWGYPENSVSRYPDDLRITITLPNPVAPRDQLMRWGMFLRTLTPGTGNLPVQILPGAPPCRVCHTQPKESWI